MARKLRALSWYELRLLVAATVALGTMRLAIRLIPFRLIIRAIGLSEGTSAETADGTSDARAVQIGRALHSAAAHTPGRDTCLVQALAGAALLRLSGMQPTLFLGVAKDGAAAEAITAHAWLRCGDITVTGQAEQHRYAPIANFTIAGDARPVS
jgi:hypothetical protein